MGSCELLAAGCEFGYVQSIYIRYLEEDAVGLQAASYKLQALGTSGYGLMVL
jgi:hypothetical protein